MYRTCRLILRTFLARRALGAVAAALLVASASGSAFALADDDLPQGRLGYRWTPDPPPQPISRENQFAINVAKWVGGAVVVIWVLRKMGSSD
jgi:hypothetical protein